MEFPVLRPSEIHRSTGHRVGAPHVLKSPFVKTQNQHPLQQQQQQQQHQRAISFASFSGYAEDGEVIPYSYDELSLLPDRPTSYWGGAGANASRTRAAAANYRGSSRTGMIDWAYAHRPSSAVLWTSSSSGNRNPLTQLSLNFDEEARNNYLESVRTFGFDYMKPPGITKTMQMVLEEEDASGDDYVEEEEQFMSEGEVNEIAGENDDIMAMEQGEEVPGPQVPPATAEAAARRRDTGPAAAEASADADEEGGLDLDDAIASASDFEFSDDEDDDEEAGPGHDQEENDEPQFEDDPFMVDEEYSGGEDASGDDEPNGLPETDPHASSASAGGSGLSAGTPGTQLRSSDNNEESDYYYDDYDANTSHGEPSFADDTFAERGGGGGAGTRLDPNDGGSFLGGLSAAGMPLPSRRSVSLDHNSRRRSSQVPRRSSAARDSLPLPRSASAHRRSSGRARLSGRIVSSEYGADLGLDDVADDDHEESILLDGVMDRSSTPGGGGRSSMVRTPVRPPQAGFPEIHVVYESDDGGESEMEVDDN